MSEKDCELSLYIISLENNKWLLHLSRQSDESILFFECQIIYQYAKKNRPLCVDSVIEIDNILNIDFYVKKYMYEYGIDNVRGGSYSYDVLKEPFLKTLNHELSIHISTFENNNQLFQEIYDKYINIKDKTILEIEYQKILKKVNSYDTLKYKLQLIQYYSFDRDYDTSILNDHSKDDTNLQINKQILDDIEWIRNQISIWKNNYLHFSIQDCMNELNRNWVAISINYSVENQEKYEEIIKKIKVVNTIYYSVFSQEINNGLNDPQTITMYKRPNLIFDMFFYDHSNTNYMALIQQNGLDNIIDYSFGILSDFENIIHYILNRIEEYEFDMASYESNFEQRSQFTIDVLYKLIHFE